MKLELKWIWPELERAFYDEHQYVTIRSARGSGKTYGAFLWLLDEMLTTDAQHALWVDTKHGNIDKYVEQYLAGNLLKDIWSRCNYNYQRKKLTLPTNTFIQFMSAEKPEGDEGFRYHRIVLNEGGIILKKSALWDNTLEPMTHPRDGIENKTRIVGTPKGRNKFHVLDSYEDWGHYHFNINDSPLYSIEEAEYLEGKIPSEVWRQEYMAEFLEGAGTVFRNIFECANVEGYSTPKAGIDYVMGVDLAKHVDFTVIMIAEKSTNKVVWMDRFNKIDWGFQKGRIKSTYEKWNRPTVIMDSTGVGDPIFDDLRNSGMQITPYKFTSTTKNELIQGLSVTMDKREISFPNWDVLIKELEVFAYEMTPSGNLRYNAPEGLHDDCVIALALTNYGLGKSYTIPIGVIGSLI